MRRLKFLFINLRLNLVLNLMIFLECILVLLLTNSTIANLFKYIYMENYIKLDSDNVIFLSGATDINVAFGDSDNFFNLVSQLENIDGVNGVAYQLEEYFISSKNESDIITTYYLNENMQKVRYPLKEGVWFSDINDDILEIIVGGNIARECKLGETITLYKSEYINNKLEYVETKAKVIGILSNPPFITDLHYASNRPHYNSIFQEHRDVILTNNKSIISKDDIRYPLNSLIIFIDENNPTIINELRKFGDPISFNSINNYSEEITKLNIKERIPTTLAIFAGVLFGLIGMTLLKAYKDMKSLSIFYLCGFSKNECIYLNVILNSIIYIFAVIVSSVLAKTPFVKEILFDGAMINKYNYIFTVVFYLIIFAFTYVIAKVLSKESAVNKLRRFD